MSKLFGPDFITQKYLRRFPASRRAKAWAGTMVHIQTENGVWRTNGKGYTLAGNPDAWVLPFEEAVKKIDHCGPEKQGCFLRAGCPTATADDERPRYTTRRLREEIRKAEERGRQQEREAALSAAEPVSSIVPDHCSGTALNFEGGCLHVRKDGSGYIVVDEDDFKLEDDRCEGEHGPEGSVHWIARFPAGEMTALRNFLKGQDFPAPPAPSGAVKALELDGVSSALAYGKGIWRTCTGCHESNEGYPTGPFSDTLKCHLGGGCFECGGIGAVWDTTDYEDMGNFIALSAQVQDVAGSPSVKAIVAERRRQIEVEGWTPEHDDAHAKGELLLAAKSYFAHATNRALSLPDGERAEIPFVWPWDKKWWKPKTPRQDLIRAGALALAEIERIKRLYHVRAEHRYIDAEAHYRLIVAELERLDSTAAPAKQEGGADA